MADAAVDQVAEPSCELKEIMPTLEMISTLTDGTEAMRDAGSTYLPQEPLEEDQQYRQRLARSFLVNYFNDAVKKIIARPFSKDVITAVPTQLDEFVADPMGTGLTFTEAAKEWFNKAVRFGVCGALVDMPSDPAETLADLQAPCAVFVPRESLLGYKWKIINREKVLTQVRIMESYYEESDFAMEAKPQIRVFMQDRWQIWREREKTEGDKSGWYKFSEGTNTLGVVPFIPLNLTGEFMEGDPPLEDLAWINIAHWQSYSDQRNALRFARIGIMFVKGVQKKEVQDMLAIGPNRIAWTANPNADAKYVEHSGAAMKIGADDLDRLERQMEQLGAQPLVERTAASTATGKSIDESKSVSLAQAWAGLLEAALEKMLQMAADWLKADGDIKVTVYKDFDTAIYKAEDMAILERAASRGAITDETFLSQLQRRGVLPDDIDVKVEAANARSEIPPIPKLEEPKIV